MRKDYISSCPCDSGWSWTSEMRAKVAAPILNLEERDMSSHLAVILDEPANDDSLRVVPWFRFPGRSP